MLDHMTALASLVTERFTTLVALMFPQLLVPRHDVAGQQVVLQFGSVNADIAMEEIRSIDLKLTFNFWIPVLDPFTSFDSF